MKRLLAATVLSFALSSPAHALFVDYETVSGYKFSTGAPITYSYDIGFISDAIRVDVDIMLYGSTYQLDVLKNRWESGIESIWSTNRFDVPILFNVDWVDFEWDRAVKISDGYGRWNTGNWYRERTYDDHERVAAHEFGHYLSLFDEYQTGSLDPSTLLFGTGGLMDVNSGPTLDYYYEPFLDWYDAKLLMYGGGGDPAPVPEPSTFLLVGAGLMAVIAARRRQAA